MSDQQPSRESIQDLAGSIATTEHAALDAEIIGDVIDVVRDVDERIQNEGSPDAIRDLLTFWDGYVAAGLDAGNGEGNDFDRSAGREALFERGNEADLYGLDIYQGLLKLAQNFETDAAGDEVSERTRQWAERVSALTLDFVDHLDDHR